ncbi:helix-turn-helix transcriptional regulator [Stackebrandtia soli]|uniref:helix-turn-helix transcriptional regulator n=1 Tax=Stackebrandtia soli TaxID=1892856 RepID=UPI0039EC4381
MLYGRTPEITIVEELVSGVRSGASGVLVIRGEAGIGKSSLMDVAAAAATDTRLIRGTGVEPESNLPYAALHLLLRPFMSRLAALPSTQAVALRGALGFDVDTAPDARFVGLAVLTLLAELAEESPVLVLVDDAHWLDRESTEALLFAARRLSVERVGVIFSARSAHAPPFSAPGVPNLDVAPLSTEDSTRLVAGIAPDVPAYVRDQIVREASGNPLALIEFPTAQREGRLSAGPYDVPGLPTHSRIQASFTERISALPAPTRDLVLVAAADGSGDLGVITAAAAALGADADDLDRAIESELLVAREPTRIEFRHPLVRAAAYQGAPIGRRSTAHRALADALAGTTGNEERRAWHLAAATTGPDEDIAAALEASAERARFRGGYNAVSIAYERAAGLSPDRGDRARRLVAAARGALDAGQLTRAESLADNVIHLSEEPVSLALAADVRANVANWRGSPMVAYGIWMDAAGEVAPHSQDHASIMLFHAAEAAWGAGDFCSVAGCAVRAEELGLRNAHRVAALATVAKGMNQLGGSTMADALDALDRLLGLVCGTFETMSPQSAAGVVWWTLIRGDQHTGVTLAEQLVDRCRRQGAGGVFPRALALQAKAYLQAGRHLDARATAHEALAIASDMGKNAVLVGTPLSVDVFLSAMEGDEARCLELVAEAGRIKADHGIVVHDGAFALLDLGLGRYEAVVDRVETLIAQRNRMDMLHVVPDFVEAAARLGQPERARSALDWYASWAEHNGQSWSAAVAARCRALLAPDDDTSGAAFAAALDLHQGRGDRPFERARTELLYGEWLRRRRRPAESRARLRSAAETFDRLRAAPWSARAAAELRAAGESAPTTGEGPDPLAALTPQELQVVRLAATGLTNRDIGAQLFLSPRTVGYHLYKAYPKLGVVSRSELGRLVVAEVVGVTKP